MFQRFVRFLFYPMENSPLHRWGSVNKNCEQKMAKCLALKHHDYSLCTKPKKDYATKLNDIHIRASCML